MPSFSRHVTALFFISLPLGRIPSRLSLPCSIKAPCFPSRRSFSLQRVGSSPHLRLSSCRTQASRQATSQAGPAAGRHLRDKLTVQLEPKPSRSCFSAISPALQPDLPIPESGSWTAYTGCFSDSPGFLSQVVSGVNTKKCYRVSFWSLCNAGSSLTDCAVAGSFGNGAVPLLYAGSAWTQTTFYGRPQNSDEILAFQGYKSVLILVDIHCDSTMLIHTPPVHSNPGVLLIGASPHLHH